ncbi:type II toxin-antitoxin system RelB/DinJ family antitoxin [Rhodobacter sp. NSM]|uniref:type II toxin-antitoxin system RelB/DinJ family antitoxin n=1 Tax=Rhodobacter sp. NSM TaxID=3457501 RepID=UPI003FD4CE08
MPGQTRRLHVRVDDRLKAEAAGVLAAIGLTMSEAVRILLTRIIQERGLPGGLTVDRATHDTWFRAKIHEALADGAAGSRGGSMNDGVGNPSGKRGCDVGPRDE